MLKKLICIAAVLFGGINVANAGLVVQTFNVATQDTDWEEFLSIQQFDDQGGTRTLESVEIFMSYSITAEGFVENLSVTDTTIIASYDATISLDDIAVNNEPLLDFVIDDDFNFGLQAYDGVTDFAGVSGSVFMNRSDSGSKSVSITDASKLTNFIGIGTIVSAFNFSAMAQSEIDGGGNISSGFLTNAGGEVIVEYVFTETAIVSAPTHVALLGFVLLGFVSLRKKFK